MKTAAGLVVVMLLLFSLAGSCVAGEEKVMPEFETVTVTTSDGVKLHIEIAGEGRPCLFLHGGPGAASDWMRKLSNGLFEKHFRMVYLDQRGAGASTSPAGGDYSMDRMVADFEEVREALGIEKWMTMGHSFGGILQMGYVERHPDVVTGMLMLNCSLDLNYSFESSWIPRAVEILGITDPAPYYDRSVSREERAMALINMMRDRGLFWKHIYLRQESEAVMAATNKGVLGGIRTSGTRSSRMRTTRRTFAPRPRT